MRVRSAAAAILVLALSACGGGSVASGIPSTGSSAPDGSAPVGSGSAAASSTALIDLSSVDACTLVDEATVEALTGASGFVTDQGANTRCFWGVPRPGVPQYLEVEVSRGGAGLEGYELKVDGASCTTVPVSGVGAEARGGICTGTQQKVYLVARDRGVVVRVLVNEPKGALTPADLAATVSAVLEGLEST